MHPLRFRDGEVRAVCRVCHASARNVSRQWGSVVLRGISASTKLTGARDRWWPSKAVALGLQQEANSITTAFSVGDAQTFINHNHTATAALKTHMNKSLISTSKFLSLILRHRPETIGVELDCEGWLDIDVLVDAATRHGHTLSPEIVQQIVAENDKQRFSISEDGRRIRASQGHSIRGVELALTPREPPDELFHGTVGRVLASIRANGLQRGSRNHVHLSPDIETARRVGMRRGKPIILIVQAAALQRAGSQFYLSDNGVWLTAFVPPEFIRFPDD